MSISTRLKGFLDENRIPYSVMTHATAYTAQGAAATMQISGRELAKTVVLRAGEQMILAVLPAPNHVRLDRLVAELESLCGLLPSRDSAPSSQIANWVPCPRSGLFTT
jgi:Ala-tRNA(Pro) deacylase